MDVTPRELVALDAYHRGFHDPVNEQVAHWDARLIERFARDHAVDVVRIADVVRVSPLDHFHPGAAGYAAIAARIAPALGAPASSPAG